MSRVVRLIGVVEVILVVGVIFLVVIRVLVIALVLLGEVSELLGRSEVSGAGALRGTIKVGVVRVAGKSLLEVGVLLLFETSLETGSIKWARSIKRARYVVWARSTVDIGEHSWGSIFL